eukprot:CAMPEP_0119550974 /NCGR_PEP_ID=MMETSP1352-20130426/4383_1 /TAXON_ID=265584 /ORGANISM="Stauroneis constricta, Strain CCMP1120" /LENGTH=341 /DNA_ID=CAMNT_0007596971 /DNA_START=149 /DNA_END=1174 /DNA_ORIENTATION=+
MKRQEQANPQYILAAVACFFLFLWTISSSGDDDADDPVAAKLVASQVASKAVVTGTPAGIIPASRPYNAEEESRYNFNLLDEYVEIYHHYDVGTSGLVVKDMLYAHAYSYGQSVTYGGSCGESSKLHETHLELLSSLGVQDVLPFRCQRDSPDDGKRRRTIPDTVFQSDGTHVFTPEYVAYLRTKVTFPPKTDNRFTIAVHIRRGKSYKTPCKVGHKEGYTKYLSNAYYQRLIDAYMQPGARVAIYSAGDSEESLDEFRQRGYEVHVDEPMGDAWKTMATSDVLILSRSVFALLPALVNKGHVVYTRFWLDPIDAWDVVDDTTLALADDDLQKAKEKLNCA